MSEFLKQAVGKAIINQEYNPSSRKKLSQNIQMDLSGHQYGLLVDLLLEQIDSGKNRFNRDEYIGIWEELTGDEWEEIEEEY